MPSLLTVGMSQLFSEAFLRFVQYRFFSLTAYSRHGTLPNRDEFAMNLEGMLRHMAAYLANLWGIIFKIFSKDFKKLG
jgi:hypothetical protein